MYFIADNIVTSFEDFHKPYTHHHTGIPLEPKAQFFNIVQKGGPFEQCSKTALLLSPEAILQKD